MADNTQPEYTYYAFISYKREDEKWAKWLQKKLESYGFPVALRKDNPSLPSKIRPIFRDQSELSGGNLKEEIEKGLKGSKYLIVICSPRAAQSPWVSKEVQYFIDNGRENNIIPFIIGGNPNAKNPEEECFPEGLRQLSGEEEILGININEMGRDAASIKVIARMFGLRFDTLWQRHERAKRRKRFAVIAGVLAFALISFVIAGIMLDLKKQANKERDNALQANKSLELANDSIKKQSEFIIKANNNLLAANDSIKHQSIQIAKVNQDLAESNRRLAEERDNVLKANWKMMENRARAVAGKANQLIDEGDSYTARLLCLEVLPKNLKNPEIPYVAEVEAALRRSLEKNSTIFQLQSDIIDIAMSPNAEFVASSTGKEIQIWNTSNGSCVEKIPCKNLYITSICFNQDNENMILGGFDGEILKLNLKNSNTWVTNTELNDIYSIKIHPNGASFITQGRDNKAILWDNLHNKKIKEFNKCSYAGYSKNGKYIIVSSELSENDYQINYYDAHTIKHVKSGKKIKSSIAVSNYDQLFATYDLANQTINIWNGSLENIIDSLKIDTAEITSMIFSHDGKYLACGTYEGDIKIWNIETGLVRTYDKHIGQVIRLYYSPDDNLISASSDKTIRLWDLNSLSPTKSFTFPDSSWYYNFNFNSNIIAVSDINTIFLFDLVTGQQINRMSGNGSVYFSDEGKNVITLENNYLCVRNSKTLELIKSIYCLSKNFTVSSDGKYIALISSEGGKSSKIEIRSSETFGIYYTILCDSDEIKDLTFSPDNRVIAYNDELDKSVKIIRIGQNADVKEVVPRNKVSSIAFSQNGNIIAIGCDNCEIINWNIANEDNISRCEGHINAITSIDFSADSKYMITGSWDSTIKVWDVNTGVCLQTYGEQSLADGAYAEVMPGNIYKVKFFPDGNKILSGSDDEKNNIKIWDFLSLEKIINIAQNRLKSRVLTPEERRKYYLE